MWSRCPMSEAERQPGVERKLRAVSRPGELCPHAHIPNDARRQLVPEADLGSDGRRLPMSRRLLGENVADQRGTREAWGAHRIARAEPKLVASIALVLPGRCEEFIPGVQMQAETLERLRHDALGFHAESVRVDAGRRVKTELHGEGRQCERLLIEVVERAESQIARLRPVVDLV